MIVFSFVVAMPRLLSTHSALLNLNHLHVTFSVTRLQVVWVPSFLRNAFSLIALSVNRGMQREGHLFAGKPRITEIGDDALGKPQKYWAIDWTAFHEAGSWARRSHKPKNYLRWRQLVIHPLPGMEAMSDTQRQTFFRKQIEELEAGHAKALKDEGQRPMTANELFALDPRDRPKEPRRKTPKPRVHASSDEIRRAIIEENREIKKAHRIASIAYLAGAADVIFPEGTFKPPIIVPVWSG